MQIHRCARGQLWWPRRSSRVPLLMFTTRRKHLGGFAFGRGTTARLWSAAAVVLALNLWMLQRLPMA